MNASTDKTQDSHTNEVLSRLDDKAENLSASLEQIRYTFDMLSCEFVNTGHYPVFLAVDKLMGCLSSELQGLISDVTQARALNESTQGVQA